MPPRLCERRELLEDEVIHHEENPSRDAELGAGPGPRARNVQNPLARDIVAALAAANLLQPPPRENADNRALVAIEAGEWWESVSESRKDARGAARTTAHANEPDVENMTWAEFETLFEDQYFPESSCDQLRDQFEKLEQGNMTVSKYAMKFQSLSRFAPELGATEERKCRRFEKGLHNTVRRMVTVQQKTKYAEVVECARSIEIPREAQRNRGVWESRQPAITASSSGTFGSQGRKRSRETSFATQSQPSVRASTVSSGVRGTHSRLAVMCHRCGQSGHFHADCRSKECYVCGEFSHLAKDCPHRVKGARNESGSVQQPGSGHGFGQQSFRGFVQNQTTQGRAFAITFAIPPPPVTSHALEASVVRGTFLLFNSFAQGFDLILGMDWLSMFHATIDCFKHRVRICPPEVTCFKFFGERREPLESYLYGSRERESICSLLASLTLDEDVSARGELPLVVCDFPDVFPEELPGLPPEKEVEFTIELLPGTAPISVPPYRFAPAKLRELKVQLQDWKIWGLFIRVHLRGEH
ncbi:uncharacterized protein LOC131306883 [Rhododendron vialii]|uniref:uncharacterized protein LOC131306883 n=1 Tax=Rhododendron vialii TaxID=182163 RepID=UPI00265D71C5|nr:uncharacterized protein LOC131306883 [Rhododendron vialii]